MTKTTSYLVFVYGTLKSAYGNNRVMTEGGTAKLLGKATTLSKFYMAGEGIPRVAKQVLGDFPASLDRNDYSGQIRGELWQIDSESLKNCDRLEGHPTFYKREQIPVTLDKDRSRHTAWLYFIVEPFRGHLCFAKNKSGVLEWPSERQYRMSRHA